jgi:transcription elongation factor S-II
MSTIIKLLKDGDLNEENINVKKNEIFTLENFIEKLGIDEIEHHILHTWELEKNKNLLLIGKKDETDEENIHQLPIPFEYQFYGDLYLVIVNDKKYQNIDLDSFENIYNALYLNMDEEEQLNEDNEYSSENDDNTFDEELEVVEDYGDNFSDDSDLDEAIEEEEKKIVRKANKIKKVIKDEPKDILFEEIELKILKNDIRIKMLDIFYSLIENITEDEKTYFKHIERELFNYTIENGISKNVMPTWNILFKNIYINKARSLYTNLCKNNYVNNVRLLDRLRNQEFTPKQFINLSHQDMFPEHWKELIDEKYRRDKVLYETKKEAMTDQFKCGKCRSKETCYYEMQTRSADESMTIFITCLNCGNRWKS